MRQKNYKPFSTTEDFSNIDHIIIGSGIGSLTTAVWLAKSGKKVIVLERHYVPGGFTHSFKRKHGFKWDVGVHYVGNVGPNDSLKPFFDYLTQGKLDWEYMGDVYDVAHIDGMVYKFKAGKDQFINQMISYFPQEAQAIKQYIKLVENANKRSSAYFFEKVFEPILQKTLGKIIKSRFKRYAKPTTFETISKLTSNKRLIAVLCAQCGDYGLPPKQSSFAAHALIVGHFLNGGYYPKGGSEQISLKTIDTLNELGSKVYINAEVSKIVISNNKVTGVIVNNTFLPSKSIISGVGISNTVNHLLKGQDNKLSAINFKAIKPSIAHMCLYVGLTKTSEELKLPKHNIWWYDNDNIDAILNDTPLDEVSDKFAYVSFPSSKDPLWEDYNPNTSSIQAISFANYKWFKEFEDEPWKKRSVKYDSLKQEFETKMLEKLYLLYPQIKGNVLVTEVSTPLSTKHFSNYKHGEIYGLDHSPKRFLESDIRPKTKIKGLYLTGQDVTVVGVGGAMMAGVLCATTILKMNSWKNFREMGRFKNKKD